MLTDEQLKVLPKRFRGVGSLCDITVFNPTQDWMTALMTSFANVLLARQRDCQRLRWVLARAKEERSWHLAWKVTAEYLFSLLNAGYELQDKLETERDELQRELDGRPTMGVLTAKADECHLLREMLDEMTTMRDTAAIQRNELQRRLKKTREMLPASGLMKINNSCPCCADWQRYFDGIIDKLAAALAGKGE